MAKRTASTISNQARDARAADRRWRKENDPFFGKRRKAGEHSGATKASAAKRACRGKVQADA